MPTTLSPLQLRALSLTANYEARRADDDPAGADTTRLEFEKILTDETAPLFVQTLPAAFLESFFGDLALRRWASRDRAAAASWMAAHPVSSPVPAAALAHGWVTSDPASLHTYLDSLPPGDWKHLIAKSAGEEALVADNLRETLALLGKITAADPRRDELYAWAVTTWALTEPAAAATWAAQIPDPALSEKLLAAAVIGYASTAPADAARLATQTITSPEALRLSLPAIVRLWAAREPAAAARWLESLPANPSKEDALAGLLSVWAPRDRAQAEAWQKNISDPPTRERAAQILNSLDDPSK